MPDAQAIVVGGGPAGSATAALLARAGHEVLLLDRARFPRDKACAEYLSPATADALARIGALARVEAQGPARPLGMHLIMRGGSRALVRYPDGTSSRRAMCLSRRVLDATLLDYARDCGVQVLEGWQVHHVVSGPGGSTVDARPVGEPAGAPPAPGGLRWWWGRTGRARWSLVAWGWSVPCRGRTGWGWWLTCGAWTACRSTARCTSGAGPTAVWPPSRRG